MSDEQVTSSVQDRYAPQFAQELARNEQEQKELEERLRQLREDHTTLSGLLAALGHETTPREEPVATPETVTDEAKVTAESVPQQRRSRKKAAASTDTEPKRAKKSAAATNAAPETKATGAKGSAGTKKGGSAKNVAAPKSAAAKKSTDAKSTNAKEGDAPKAGRGPTLQDVVSGLLDQHAPERRTVREIFDELKQKHPERASSTQSVRNALNGLLRKGAIEREEKQGAVWFGVATTGSSAATPASAVPTTPESATTTDSATTTESTSEKTQAETNS
ncbi:hypothetical protein [Streptomyces sp. NPDC002851]